MVAVSQPDWRLLWRGRDVTADLRPAAIAIRYTDVIEGESDELEVTLEDRDGLWRGPWLPRRGDTLRLQLGYVGEPLCCIGQFELDEVSFSGPPDSVTLRCLAARVTAVLRTASDMAYEGQTLRDIAGAIASRNGLELVGCGAAPGRNYARVTQHREHDLAFLNRLGLAEGIVFSVKDHQLVWHDKSQLDAAAPALTIERTAVTSYNLKLASAICYRSCRVSYHDPVRKELISATAEAPDIPSGDCLQLVRRCETAEQAQAKAQAELRAANGRQLDGTIKLVGDPRLRAGVNVQLNGFGALDVKAQILRAEHSLQRGAGYTTGITLGAPTAQGVVP
ncbi:contractile injection system protein, VgrG/Pvc8 family [Desulfuromonas thiophila]|uniref:phage late control D family protein n=1 Tax=Desulfuromonas thiophila TaxID=57664 RepID=UPI0029F592EC|nr:contractile injection system protein, VgrG/Pvc8 family [Desulfuromonas thiophila]